MYCENLNLHSLAYFFFRLTSISFSKRSISTHISYSTGNNTTKLAEYPGARREKNLKEGESVTANAVENKKWLGGCMLSAKKEISVEQNGQVSATRGEKESKEQWKEWQKV